MISFYLFLAAATFFSYEMMKNLLEPMVSEDYRSFTHVISACIGEVVRSTAIIF